MMQKVTRLLHDAHVRHKGWIATQVDVRSRSMRSILLSLVFACVVASFVDAEEAVAAEGRQYTAEELQKLTDDDDWLTGVWLYDSDAAMSLYTLFEKSDTGYRALYFYPRYTVTWWTGRVEKEGDVVRLWDYQLEGDKIILPDEPAKVFQLRDGVLRLNQDRYYDTLLPVTTAESFSYLARQKFLTGEAWLRHKVAEAERLRGITEHYDLIKNSAALCGHSGDLVEIEVIRTEIDDNSQFFLARIAMARPPQSGMHGSVPWFGYYWAHLKEDTTGLYHIQDDWLLTEFANKGYLRLNLVTDDDGSYKIIERDQDAELGSKAKCYTFPEAGISRKPLPCEAE